MPRQRQDKWPAVAIRTRRHPRPPANAWPSLALSWLFLGQAVTVAQTFPSNAPRGRELYRSGICRRAVGMYPIRSTLLLLIAMPSRPAWWRSSSRAHRKPRQLWRACSVVKGTLCTYRVRTDHVLYTDTDTRPARHSVVARYEKGSAAWAIVLRLPRPWRCYGVGFAILGPPHWQLPPRTRLSYSANHSGLLAMVHTFLPPPYCALSS